VITTDCLEMATYLKEWFHDEKTGIYSHRTFAGQPVH
jgi:hypothetical protein